MFLHAIVNSTAPHCLDNVICKDRCRSIYFGFSLDNSAWVVSFCVYYYCPRIEPKRPEAMTGGCLRRLIIRLTGFTGLFCYFLLYFFSVTLFIAHKWGYFLILFDIVRPQSPHKPCVPVYHVRGLKLFLAFTQKWLRVETGRPVATFLANCQIFISMSTQRPP